MSELPITILNGVNHYINPINQNDGDLLYAHNVDFFPYGAITKRAGYEIFLGTADGKQVNTLLDFTVQASDELFLLRASGSAIYSSKGGTGVWTQTGNGTITNGRHIGYAELGDALIVGDGAGSTRHTTNGTAFTNTSLAPIAQYFVQYQNSIYAGGTADTLFKSSSGEGTNWQTSGTSDSTSLDIPGAGKINSVIKASDRVVVGKTGGNMFKWDGYSLVDTSTRMAFTSPYSIDEKEGYYLGVNRDGVIGYGGDKPKLLSNAVQRYFYNRKDTGMSATYFESGVGKIHRYDYLFTMGTVTDDFINKTIPNAILAYDIQKNQYRTYGYAHFPTAMLSYRDATAKQQLIFGDATGQCYKVNPTATSDAGTPISSEVIYVMHMGAPQRDKKFNSLFCIFNPGCQAQIQVAIQDNYTFEYAKWQTIGSAENGIYKHIFGQDSRGKLLFIRISERSSRAPWTYYGSIVDADVEHV